MAKRWWYLLVLCPIVAGLAAFFIVQRIPSVYEATETVAVNPATSVGGVADVQTAQALADTYAEQMHASPVLTAAAQSLGLSDTSASSLSGMVQTRRVPNTSLVRLSVQATDPGLAAQITTAVVQTFIDQHAEGEGTRATATQNNLVGLITQLQNNQDALNQQLDGLRAEPASPERDALIGRLQDQLTQVQTSQTAASRGLQDLQLAAARSGSELTVVDPATVPTTPVRPNRLLSVAMAVLFGFLAALGIVWLTEQFDDRLRGASDVLRALQLPTLARIPQSRSGIGACNPSDSAVVASFAVLRSNVLSAVPDVQSGRGRTIAVTSAFDGEGKSAVAANLAAALAHTGRSVVLVDADLARPAQASLFNVKNESGLAALLMIAVKDATDFVVPTCVENVRLLVAGTTGFESAEPAALLMSKCLPEVLEQLAAKCDVLIVDAPAVLDCPEAAWLSARTDGALVVLDTRRARTRTVEPALASLADAGAAVFGVVLNRARGRAVAEPRTQSQSVEQSQPATETRPAPSTRPGGELVHRQGIVGPATDGS